MRSLEKAGPHQIWWSVALGYTTSPIMLKQYSPPEILGDVLLKDSNSPSSLQLEEKNKTI